MTERQAAPEQHGRHCHEGVRDDSEESYVEALYSEALADG